MTRPPALRGVHHLKLPVSALERSVAFYERVLGARRLRDADHVDAEGSLYACILEVPGLGTLLELRRDAKRARVVAGFDPVTLAVDDRTALAAWRDHLAVLDVPHSGEITSLRAWLVVLADPDGLRVRLMTREEHGPEVAATVGDLWV